MESCFVILLSFGVFFAFNLVVCIPVLLLALQRTVESYVTPRATQGRQFVARRIATNCTILLLHFRGFRILEEKEEYYII